MNRKITSVVVLILACCLVAGAADYWGGKRSDKYHFPSCEWAQKIIAIGALATLATRLAGRRRAVEVSLQGTVQEECGSRKQLLLVATRRVK